MTSNAATNDINTILLTRITSFINEIGINCHEGVIPATTFLPGIEIRNGGIIYDPAQLKYPGDLLHEAGHLAVLRPQHRAEVCGSRNISGDINEAAAEMSAIAWSWAAVEQLKIAPHILFHEHGYAGWSPSLLDNFGNKKYLGVPMLQLFGMTIEPKRDVVPCEHTYPNMICWLRQ